MTDADRPSIEVATEPTPDVADHSAVPAGGFRTYPIRFFGLTMIALLNIASSINWLNFAPAPQLAAEYFDTNLSAINFLSTGFIFCFLLTSGLSGLVFSRYGIRAGLLTGAIVQAIGAWIKYFATFAASPATRFGLVIFGQILVGLVQPFVLNAPTMYASVWFSENGRATANMIGTVANPLGIAIADLLIPALVPDVASYPMGILVISIITTAVCIPVLFIPERPPTPPSFSASTTHEPFFQGVMKLARNVNFLILLTTFSIGVGLFNTVSSLLNQIVVPYGYSDDDAGILGAVMVVAGLVGAVIAGPLVDRTKQHKLALKVIVPVVAVVYIILIFVVRENSYAPIALICALLGLTSFSLLPIALELGVECTYPVSESTSSSVLWGAGQLMAVVLLPVNSALREPDNAGTPPGNMRNALILDGVLCAVSASFVLFYRSRNLRMDMERSQKERMEELEGRKGEMTEIVTGSTNEIKA